jgi:uncharacterized protein YdeI (BOF family)
VVFSNLRQTTEVIKLFNTKFTLVGLLFLIAGCGKAPETTLGVRSAAASTMTVKELANAPKAQKVTLHGEMIEKCPVAGCWFRLRDRTGVIKVDTKPAGFVVVNVPLESTVTVAGKVVTAGDEVVIEATGIRY